MGINPEVNIIAGLGFELAYYDIAVQHVGQYDTEIPSGCMFLVVFLTNFIV